MQKFKAYCISLEETPERMSLAKDSFSNAGIDVEFLIEKKHPNGRVGCWNSHIKVWSAAKSKGEDVIFVFEDDVILNEKCDHLNEIYADCLEAFNKDKDLCVINLSKLIVIKNSFITNNVMHSESLTLSSYVINVDRIFKIKKDSDFKSDNSHLDASLLLDNTHKLYVKSGSYYPLPKIDNRVESTNNDYGLLLNLLINKFGYKMTISVGYFIIQFCSDKALLNNLSKRLNVYFGRV